MNTRPLIDAAERVGWTFIQAVAGSITAGGTAVALGQFDVRAALAGGGVAALMCLLKVAGVQLAATGARAAAAQAAPPAPPVEPHAVEPPADVIPAAARKVAAVEVTSPLPAVPASGWSAEEIAQLSAASAAP
jgi:hypothetical protein